MNGEESKEWGTMVHLIFLLLMGITHYTFSVCVCFFKHYENCCKGEKKKTLDRAINWLLAIIAYSLN